MVQRLVLPMVLLTALFMSGHRAVAETDSKIDRLFELMRMTEVLRGYPQALMDGLDESTDWEGPVSRDDVTALAEKHFSPQVLTGDLKKLLQGELTPAMLDSEIAFFGSGFGQRVATMEAAAADPALEKTIEREGARIYQDLVAAEAARVELIHRMIEGAGLIDWGMAAGMNLGYALMAAMMGDQMSEEQILAAINANMGGMRVELTRIMNGSVAYTYRALTDAELERYVARYETPDGKKIMKTVMDAYRVVLVERSRAFGFDLRTLMRQRRS